MQGDLARSIDQARTATIAGDAADAERLWRELLDQPALDSADRARALTGLGFVLQRRGDAAGAVEQLRRAAALLPQEPACHSNLAALLERCGRFAEAAASVRALARLKPDDPGIHRRLGECLAAIPPIEQTAETQRDAVRAFEQAASLAPDDRAIQDKLARAYFAAGDFAAAERVFRSLLDPADGGTLYNLALAVRRQRRLDEAVALLDRAIAADPTQPQAREVRAAIQLTHGDYASGFIGLEHRHANPTIAAFVRPWQDDGRAWDGAPLAGRRILLYGEQGFGDVIQFARYVPAVAGQAGEVVLEVPAALAPLLRHQAGFGRIVAVGEPLPEVDCHAGLMSLPRLFGTRLHTIPAAPYLTADPVRVTAWRGRLRAIAAGRPLVGVVWASGLRARDADLIAVYRRKSVALAALADLLQVPDVAWVSLQKGPEAAEAAAFPRVLDVSPALADFAETAAALANLDLVVTIDTAVAHLAGALGRPVWTMLPFDSCWRWLLDRDDSPWYPTMRLYRQPDPASWQPVVARVAADLQAWAGGRRR